jgi:quercetin dioxygenase-like cupin family protein
VKVLLHGEQTGGALSLVQTESPAGAAGPRLHRHDFDETFYVLEGELTFQLEDQVFTRGAGELAFAPRNVPHTYANKSGERARLLIVCTPAGFERYFARIQARQEGVDPPEWANQPIPEVVILGPQIGG